jgi:hypothetical protein
VDTAAGGGSAVHPRTGSLFAPRRFPLQDAEETEHLTTAQPPHSHTTSPGLEPSELLRNVTPGPEHIPLLPKTVAADMRSTARMPSQAAAAPRPAGSPADAVDAPSWRSSAEPAGSPLVEDADVHFTVAAPAHAHGKAGDAFQPVVTSARTSEAGASAAESRDTPRQRQTPRAAQQPDDIQIHIGRIEVIAVPPPAPRAPKAPDRSPSLDAYLSRRHGRSR